MEVFFCDTGRGYNLKGEQDGCSLVEDEHDLEGKRVTFVRGINKRMLMRESLREWVLILYVMGTKVAQYAALQSDKM